MRFSPDAARDARRSADLTQEALARLSGTSVDTLRRLEQGRHVPAAETIAKVARALGVPMETLFEADEVTAA